jgi:hypothetical protein
VAKPDRLGRPIVFANSGRTWFCAEHVSGSTTQEGEFWDRHYKRAFSHREAGVQAVLFEFNGRSFYLYRLEDPTVVREGARGAVRKKRGKASDKAVTWGDRAGLEGELKKVVEEEEEEEEEEERKEDASPSSSGEEKEEVWSVGLAGSVVAAETSTGGLGGAGARKEAGAMRADGGGGDKVLELTKCRRHRFTEPVFDKKRRRCKYGSSGIGEKALQSIATEAMLEAVSNSSSSSSSGGGLHRLLRRPPLALALIHI